MMKEDTKKAETAEVQEVQEEQEVQKTEAQEEKIRVVVLAYDGTEELLVALWKKKFSGRFRIVPLEAGEVTGHSLLAALVEIMADSEVDNDFVLVQPNCFPVAPCDLQKLQIPLVYTTADGKEVYSSRLPARLDKDTLAEMLGDLEKEEDFVAEDLFRKAAEGRGSAIAAGHNFGNIVFQVLSGSPCRNKVVGALLTKHYFATSLTGWNAIRDILQEYLESSR